jgi:hypothetical protein
VTGVSTADGTTVDLVLNIASTQSDIRVDRSHLTLNENEETSVSGTVPDQFYYRVRAFQDIANYSLNTWWEQQ